MLCIIVCQALFCRILLHLFLYSLTMTTTAATATRLVTFGAVQVAHTLSSPSPSFRNGTILRLYTKSDGKFPNNERFPLLLYKGVLTGEHKEAYVDPCHCLAQSGSCMSH